MIFPARYAIAHDMLNKRKRGEGKGGAGLKGFMNGKPKQKIRRQPEAVGMHADVGIKKTRSTNALKQL